MQITNFFSKKPSSGMYLQFYLILLTFLSKVANISTESVIKIIFGCVYLDISPSTVEARSSQITDTNATPLPANVDRPFHPPQNFAFPKKQQGKQKRSCQSKWFVSFPWLHYDQQNDHVLCFNCMKQDRRGNLQTATKREKAFISSGFSSWKDALECFRDHESSECHKISSTHETIIPTCGNVKEMISKAAKTEMALNRKCLIKIIECLQFLGRQGIAFQGNTDEESNFVQLLRLRCKDDKDLAK